MTRRWKFEVAVGLFVVAGLAALLMLAVRVGNLTLVSDAGAYHITARFDNIGGLKVRAPVSMSGIKIGQVVALDFDPVSYEAVATLAIGGRFNQVPLDSTASIFTAGLLGEQYVAIEPGADEEYMEEGDEIDLTQSALVLEELIQTFLSQQMAARADEKSADEKK